MTLVDLYQLPILQPNTSVASRIDFLTKLFLEKPYISNPQGEGDNGEFDQSPLYRFDGFDCVTYVNNILALAFSNNPTEFQKNLLKINYYDAKPLYENRFHFMSLDWNIQNQKNNFLKDVTENFYDHNKKSIAVFAEGDIDKANWFLHKSKTDARLAGIAKNFKKQFVRLPYLPLTKVFDHFNQFPDISVIEIVRPNWPLREKIGTNLHVSHVGFGLRQQSGEILFRHASSEAKCVVEVFLKDYLSNFLESETIKGINVQSVYSFSSLDARSRGVFGKTP